MGLFLFFLNPLKFFYFFFFFKIRGLPSSITWVMYSYIFLILWYQVLFLALFLLAFSDLILLLCCVIFGWFHISKSLKLMVRNRSRSLYICNSSEIFYGHCFLIWHFIDVPHCASFNHAYITQESMVLSILIGYGMVWYWNHTYMTLWYVRTFIGL